MEALRFTAVAIGGVIIDLAVAYTAAEHFALPLWIAATTGFVIAALVNYAAHELWTFRVGARRISARRAVQYLAVSSVALATRLVMVVLLEAVIGSAHTLPILVGAAGVSFMVNFALSKLLVFTGKLKLDAADR